MSDEPRFVVRYAPTNSVVSKPSSKQLAERICRLMNAGRTLYVVEEWGWPDV